MLREQAKQCVCGYQIVLYVEGLFKRSSLRKVFKALALQEEEPSGLKGG